VNENLLRQINTQANITKKHFRWLSVFECVERYRFFVIYSPEIPESRAAARKPRDAAAIPAGFHCHVVTIRLSVRLSVCDVDGL